MSRRRRLGSERYGASLRKLSKRQPPFPQPMIDILIVDDDAEKAARVRSLCESVLSGYSVNVEHTGTVNAALAHMRRQQYDLLVLDLNLPVRERESPRADAGLRILNAVSNGSRVIPPRHIVGLSAYDAVIESSQSTFSDGLWSLLRYDATTREWERGVAAKLLYLAKTDQSRSDYRTDLAIVTALHKVELEAVLDLPGPWEQQHCDGDDSVYHRTRWTHGHSQLSVVAVSGVEMGMAAASALAMKAIGRFRPRFLCMVGIAAGTSLAYSFGDVLVATEAFDYGAGKTAGARTGKGVFQPAPSPIRVDPWLHARLRVFEMTADISKLLTQGWKRGVSARPLLRFGPIATGAAVIADRRIVSQILKRNRKVVGLEMEAFGVLMASQIADEPKPKAFALKSVCDFAGKTKNDEYQRFAAHTSARCLYEFSLKFLASAERDPADSQDGLQGDDHVRQ